MVQEQTQIFYLTKEGLAKIKKEFEDLKEIRAEKTRGDVPKPLQSEDVNLEYLAFREDMELLDGRLQELEMILKNYKMIKPPAKKDPDTVYLGADVSLQDSLGNKVDLKIVGTLETDPFDGKISNESPVGKALLGHKIGDVISVSNPFSPSYRILNVCYGEV